MNKQKFSRTMSLISIIFILSSCSDPMEGRRGTVYVKGIVKGEKIFPECGRKESKGCSDGAFVVAYKDESHKLGDLPDDGMDWFRFIPREMRSKISSMKGYTPPNNCNRIGFSKFMIKHSSRKKSIARRVAVKVPDDFVGCISHTYIRPKKNGTFTGLMAI